MTWYLNEGELGSCPFTFLICASHTQIKQKRVRMCHLNAGPPGEFRTAKSPSSKIVLDIIRGRSAPGS